MVGVGAVGSPAHVLGRVGLRGGGAALVAHRPGWAAGFHERRVHQHHPPHLEGEVRLLLWQLRQVTC